MSLFNFILVIRQLAAIAVIFSHSFILYDGHSHDPLEMLLGIDFAFFAVLTFFVLSGRLIYLSFFYSKDIKQYVLKRCLRILPALVVCIVSTSLIACFLSGDPIAFIFTNDWVSYLLNIGFVGGYSLPILFDANPYPNVANGSLWTLRYEVLMYAVVPLLFIAKNFRKLLLLALVLLLIFASFILLDDRSFSTNFLRLGVAFFVGALFSVLEGKLEVVGVGVALSLMVLLLGFVGLEAEVVLAVLVGVVFSFIIFFVRWYEGGKWSWDYSYGIYIYGFFIQQVLVRFYHFDSALEFFGVSLFVSIFFGWFSWNFVEKPFLRFKKVI